MSTRSGAIAGALLAAAGLALVAIPLWPEAPQSANRRLEDRIDVLEKTVDKADDRARGADAKTVANEALIDELTRIISRLEPPNAAWIDLRSGGGNKWVLDSGAEATVKFVSTTDAGIALRINHKTLDDEFLLRPGESVRAIDDRGTELRVYTTTLHSIERDRTGAPRRARVSVAYGIEYVQ
ncbi:MAG: hypothetical protein KDA24_15080 [Deltaproteobacteria bacterium]|nr:hypothetical protein [Deltaproteobacteria bacterium]